MEISIVEERENAVLKRKEVRFKVEFEGATPSRKDVKEKLCHQLKAKPELVIVDELGQRYGLNEASGYAKIYSDADALKVELKHNIRRDKGEKAEKKEKAKKETPKTA